MKKTKKLTVSAIMMAFSVVIMTIGAYVDVMELTVGAILSLVTVFVFIEVGSPYVWLLWLGASGLGAIFFTSSPVWISYLLIFGLMPILKGYIERLHKAFWLPIKAAYSLVSIIAMAVAVYLITGVPVFDPAGLNLPFSIDGRIVVGVLYAATFVSLLIYDYLLTLWIGIYLHRIRNRFQRFLR